MSQGVSSAANVSDGTSFRGVPFPFAVVVLDIGGTKIAGGIALYQDAESCPEIHCECSIPTLAKEGGAAVLDRVIGQAGNLITAARENEALADVPIKGIGVSAAGSIRESDGLVAYANDIMPGWMGQPLGGALEKAYGLPVAVQNDVHAHALGEVRHGSAKGYKVVIVAAAGTGLGGAIVIDGKVFGGARGYAGMLGHTQHPAASGIACTCGSVGHLESVASGSGIEECYRRAGGESLSGPEISNRAEAGEVLAESIIEQAGRSFGESIGSWAKIVDPDLVVVSGSVCAAGPIWKDALEDGLKSQLAKEQQDLELVQATLGGKAPLVGAAEKLLDKVFCR